MTKASDSSLSRRERQIMDIIYERGRASAADVLEALPDPPSYSAVRALLRILEEKGHLKHKRDGARYIFSPVKSRRSASQSAVQRVMRTFFDNSIEKTVAALLDVRGEDLSQDELRRLSKMIEEAREEGR